MEVKTDMVSRFGAAYKVEMRDPTDRQLFLVRARQPGARLAALVRAQGGQVVLQGAGWLLAEVGYEQAMVLKQSAGIGFVSGVTVDRGRLEWLRKAVGAASGKIDGSEKGESRCQEE